MCVYVCVGVGVGVRVFLFAPAKLHVRKCAKKCVETQTKNGKTNRRKHRKHTHNAFEPQEAARKTMSRRHESVGPARSGASIFFLNILDLSSLFGNRCWLFSALFRPPPGPGRSQDVAMVRPWLRPGFSPAPGEAEKGPNTANNDSPKA